jgi:predicted molibdopterin-dependent oxidoreductase YjgC
MVSKTAVLRGLARKPFVELSDADAGELGLADGDEVVLASNGYEERATLRIADVARGAAFIPFDQEGLRANRLMAGVNPMIVVRPA